MLRYHALGYLGRIWGQQSFGFAVAKGKSSKATSFVMKNKTIENEKVKKPLSSYHFFVKNMLPFIRQKYIDLEQVL